jgi:hypothetical protein
MKSLSGMKLALLAVVVAVAAGCAATQQLSEEDRAKVKTAKIAGNAEKPPQIFLMAPSGANIGMLFGAIGGAVTGATMEDNQKVFIAFLEKHGISIEKIAQEEFAAALRASGKLAIAGQGDAAAPTIKVSVPQYGFGVPHLLSSNVVPVLWIKCDMVDGSGKQLWSANERMLPSIASPVEATTWEAMAGDPKKIEDEWRKASKILAQKIVADL